MPKKKQKPASKPNGRPSKFDPDLIEQAYKLALLGLTDVQMADIFGVSEKTLNNWKHAHPGFLQSLKAGKLIADGEVTASLYKRANGYSHAAVKIFNDRETGVTTVPYTEYYPPDTTACIFWLKNRQSAMWRDKIENTTQLVDDKNNPINPREIARRLAFLLTAGVQQPEESKLLH